MKVESAEVLSSLLSRRAVFEVPIFQRKYSWEKSDCASLLEDIQAMIEKGPTARHFINALIYQSAANSATPSIVSHYTLIDGQQRLTTIMLILKNLALITPKSSECYEEILAMLYESKSPRLSLKSEDASTFESIMRAQNEQDLETLYLQKRSSRLIANFFVIREFMQHMQQSYDDAYKRIYAAILRIYAVCINLEENDNAQEIFQSINSNGRLLSQSDLIRNYLLLGLDYAQQRRIYETYWKILEQSSDERHCKLDDFFRKYLRFRFSSSVTANRIYSSFAEYAQDVGDLDALLDDVIKYFNLYTLFFGANIHLANINKEAKTHLKMFNQLGFMTAASYIFAIYEAGFSQSEFNEILRLLLVDTIRKKFADPEKSRRSESFYDTLRNNLKTADKAHYVEDLRELLKHQYNPKKKNPLSDKEFEKAILSADFKDFHQSFTKTILCALENYQAAERVEVLEQISIEHIMPQKPNTWGIDEKDQKFLAHLNLIGNLSLTGVNAQLGNRPFAEKLSFYKETKFSRLYEDVLSHKKWDYAAINARSKKLAKRLVELFSFSNPAAPESYQPFCAREFAIQKIKSARFKGVELKENSYKGIYLAILHALAAADAATAQTLAAKGFRYSASCKKPHIATDATGMNVPANITKGVVAETCFSAEAYARLIPAVLRAFGCSEGDLELLYE